MEDPNPAGVPLDTLAPGVRGALGPIQAAVQARLAAFDRDRVPTRLWARDVSLWKAGDPKHAAVVANRLGWLDAAGLMRTRAPALSRLGADAMRDGFERAVLLGMGGSSLAAEVFAMVFGRHAGGLPLHVLDSTVPAGVTRVLDAAPLHRTLFIVASKSGTTVEVDSLYKHIAGRLPAERRGAQFVAITDPGTALDVHARSAGFRAVFDNPPDIGGRFSALSLFGLVPAGFLGIDVDPLLASAEAMATACGPDRPAAQSPAAWLGAVMAEGALSGRDKLTLLLSPTLAPFGRWVEQLVAESTGKEGQGVLPIDGEPDLPPGRYGDDRAFVVLRLADEPDPRAEALAAAGHPVVELVLRDRFALGGEMLRWALATAFAGVALGVNPFDEPDVKDSKDRTNALLARFVREGALPPATPVASGEGVELFADASLSAYGTSPGEWLRAHFARVRPGDYVGLLAYLPATPEVEARMADLRDAVVRRLGCATTVGFGPRFLHSTGQLFKGGPDTGVFLQITADDPDDLEIPGAPYGFATLAAAQARGDLEALHDRGRRAVRCHLGSDLNEALATLSRLVTGALAHGGRSA